LIIIAVSSFVGKNIPRMVEDDIKYDPDDLIMGCLNQLLKILSAAIAGISIEEIKCSVAMIASALGNLFKYGVEP